MGKIIERSSRSTKGHQTGSKLFGIGVEMVFILLSNLNLIACILVGAYRADDMFVKKREPPNIILMITFSWYERLRISFKMF